MQGGLIMPSIDNYCLKPDYFTGVSQGNGNNVDTANDRWLNKNRASHVKYGDLYLYASSMQVNRDSSHGSFMGYQAKNVTFNLAHADYGNAIAFQCKGV